MSGCPGTDDVQKGLKEGQSSFQQVMACVCSLEDEGTAKAGKRASSDLSTVAKSLSVRKVVMRGNATELKESE